jgi:tRNA threonylcarbamoyladenosine biosynthesis protein TsaE
MNLNETVEYLKSEIVSINDRAGKTHIQDRNCLYIFLEGEMGAGKTHLVKKLAESLGVQEVVSSPTFIVVNEYDFDNSEEKKLVGKLYHADLWRLDQGVKLADIGLDPGSISHRSREGGVDVVAIEWPGKLDNKQIDQLDKRNDVVLIDLQIDLLSNTERNYEIVFR